MPSMLLRLEPSDLGGGGLQDLQSRSLTHRQGAGSIQLLCTCDLQLALEHQVPCTVKSGHRAQHPPNAAFGASRGNKTSRCPCLLQVMSFHAQDSSTSLVLGKDRIQSQRRQSRVLEHVSSLTPSQTQLAKHLKANIFHGARLSYSNGYQPQTLQPPSCRCLQISHTFPKPQVSPKPNTLRSSMPGSPVEASEGQRRPQGHLPKKSCRASSSALGLGFSVNICLQMFLQLAFELYGLRGFELGPLKYWILAAADTCT